MTILNVIYSDKQECIKCKEAKDRSSFYNKRNKNGELVSQTTCKECLSLYNKQRRFENISVVDIDSLNNEEWKEYEDAGIKYLISNLGRTFSPEIIGYRHHKVELKQHESKKGYLTVHLKSGLKAIHRLVAILFIPNPLNLPQVNHKDGNKKNNKVDNLEWCDNSYNQKHAWALGLISNTGMKSPRRILDENQVKEIFFSQLPHKAIAEKYGIEKSGVNKIKTGRNWGHFTKTLI